MGLSLVAVGKAVSRLLGWAPVPSQALLQRGKKPYRLVMLFKEISESLCRKLRERAAGLFRNSFYRVPSIVIKSDSLTVHDQCP